MRSSAFLVLLPGWSVLACGGAPTEQQPVAFVQMGPGTVDLSALGDTVRLHAAARAADGSAISGVSWEWRSSDEQVATVSSSGLVTAVGNGAAIVTASTSGFSDSADVTVQQVATAVVITPPGSWVSDIGATQEFTVEASDANGFAIVSPVVTWNSLNTNVATIDGDGVAAAVASGQVTLTADVSGGVGYALLTVSVPGVSPVASWSVVPSGGSAICYAVWGSSSSDVFAVGESAAILHYDGVGWSGMTSPSAFDQLGLWGTSSTDVFAVGGPMILHYDGTAWTWIENSLGGLTATWGSSSRDVYMAVAGGVGAVVYYDGTSWSEVGSVPSALFGVWGTSSSDVFVVGEDGTILRSDETNPLLGWSGWSAMASGTSETLHAVWGTSPADIFAVGENGTILHYDGSSWTGMSSGTSEILNGVWGTSGSDVYAVGANGTILHYDGMSWSAMTSGTTDALQGVWGTSSGDVHVAGKAGAMLRGSR